MKKTRFLALALVVAIALMGAGYAAWKDYTNLDTTVSTGNLEVNVPWAHVTTPPHVGATIEGAETGNLNPNPKEITVKVTDLYPTVYDGNNSDTFVRIHFAVENDGTVPVMLDNIEFTPKNPSSPVWDYLKTVIHMHQGKINPDGSTSSPVPVPGKDYSLTGVNSIGDFQNKYLKDLDQLLLGVDTDSKLATTVLMPGETIWFGGPTEEESSIRFWLDKGAPDSTELQEDFGFTLKLNWKQFNMPSGM